MNETVRVLVVDDAAFMRRSLIKLLSSDPSLEIVGEAANGREAVELADTLRPDVICLDLDMPQMDGLTALKHLMSRRPTPVVVVSSLTDRENVPFETLRLGVLDFFPKPSASSGSLESQARHLLYLVRNARRIRSGNLRRVPLDIARARLTPRQHCEHVVVLGGTVGSVSGLLRVLTLLPPQPVGGFSVLCQVPVHPAIVSSFVDSLRNYLGWEVERLSGLSPIRSGVATFLPSGSAVAWQGDRLALVDGGTDGLDSLFVASGERFGANATLILLAGDTDEGLRGLREAAAHGAACFVQDDRTALFSSWAPALDRGIGRFDLDHVLDSLGRALLARLGDADGPETEA
ncbi:MAG: response regulator [Holophagales bacterium]|nr:response regulator [Holophagales bacterium]MBK9966404.1 response regulator [Holophagales bacterium]